MEIPILLKKNTRFNGQPLDVSCNSPGPRWNRKWSRLMAGVPGKRRLLHRENCRAVKGLPQCIHLGSSFRLLQIHEKAHLTGSSGIQGKVCSNRGSSLCTCPEERDPAFQDSSGSPGFRRAASVSCRCDFFTFPLLDAQLPASFHVHSAATFCTVARPGVLTGSSCQCFNDLPSSQLFL